MKAAGERKHYRIHKFYIFIGIILILKIFLGGLFTSDYQEDMFIPFVNQFLNGLGNKEWNVYQYYYEYKLVPSFPYPPMMLLIESIGILLAKNFSDNYFLYHLLFKAPLFFFDFLGLYYLVKLFPAQRRYAGVVFFASPIILYAVYMHGQLDIIPTTLLFGSLFYLSRTGKHRYYLSAVMFAMALLCKMHVIAVFPLILIYLTRKNGFKYSFKYLLIISAITIVFIFPFWSTGFVQTVLLNTEQSVLMTVFFDYKTVKLYLPICAVIILYYVVFHTRIINKSLLISFCGIIFALFLSLCPPMPGWYVWITPFIAVFFITINENKYQNAIIYYILNGLYLVYFVFFHKTVYVDLYYASASLDWIKYDDVAAGSLVFTGLCATLFYIIGQLYRFGIASNSYYKRKSIPFTIGISGDSGSGKSTLLNIIEKALGKHNLLYIEGDGDHKWERGEKMWQEFTHLNPKANYLYRQARDIEMLRSGVSTNRVEYDHNTGKFSKEHKLRSKKYVILCGLHSLYLPQMRNQLDLKIYMDADENLRRYWKIQRDVNERGYSKEKILAQIESRMSDAERYIYPQMQYADMVISYFDETLTDCMEDNHPVVLSVRMTLSAAIDLESILQKFNELGVGVKYDFSEDLKKQVVEIDGLTLQEISISVLEKLISYIPQLDEITMERLNVNDNLDGVVMLFILLLVSKKMQEEL